jgi:DNA end-binding protein Ku
MRSLWTGAIGFGLVNIPVSIFNATQSSSLDLNMLDKKDLSNIRYKKVNEKTGREVPGEDIVKGYEYNGHYVVLNAEDFKKASPEKTKVIAIEDFVKESEIPSIYYDTPYYLQADKQGARAYALLREAMVKTGKVGVASFVMRNRESLAIVKPYENLLLLNEIRFQEEIRSHSEIDAGKPEIKKGELKMAINLIDQLTEKFDISAYCDTYTEELLKLIEAKAKRQKVKAPKLRIVHSQARDLMDQLKASLETRHRKAS